MCKINYTQLEIVALFVQVPAELYTGILQNSKACDII